MQKHCALEIERIPMKDTMKDGQMNGNSGKFESCNK